MLVIKSNQSIQEVVDEFKRLSKYKEELKVLVESLPDPLESEIGLDHFLYMLQNYPRKIRWISDDEEIAQRYQNRGIEIERFNPFSSKTDRILEEIDRLSAADNNNQNHINIQYLSAPALNLENTFLNPNQNRRDVLVNPVLDRIEDNSLLSGFEKVNFQENASSRYVEPQMTVIGEENFEHSGPTIIVDKTPEIRRLDLATKPVSISIVSQQIESESKIENGSYIEKVNQISESEITPPQSTLTKPKSAWIRQQVSADEDLGYELEEMDQTQITDTPSTRDLDRVRSKILVSKEVLNSINNPSASIASHSNSIQNLITGQIDHVSQLIEKDESKNSEKPKSKTRKYKSQNVNLFLFSPLKYVYILSFGLIVILAMVGVLLGLPSVAYTVQITNEKKENQATFTFEKNQLNQQNLRFDLTAKTDTTGTISLTDTRARGKVRLLNKTGNSIDLNLAKFYLLKDDKRYNAVYDTTRQQSIVVPSKNHLSGPIVEIDVESGSVSNQNNYDLNEGEELIPVNLQGVPLGPNFTAVVSDPILSNKLQTNRTVTEGDLRTLRSTIESNLINQKQTKLSEIDGKKYISNVNWSTNIESEFSTDKKLGDPADSVNMTARVSADMYYLDKKLLVDQILSRENTAEQVTKIEISNGEIAWNKDTQKLTLEVKYILALKSDISKDKVKEIVKESGFDTDSAKNKIKSAYPGISDIKASVSGAPVPISPRIEVEVVQTPIAE